MPMFELFIEESRRTADDEYPDSSPRNSQSAIGDRVLWPRVFDVFRTTMPSGPNPRASSEASGVASLTLSPTMKEKDPSEAENVCLRLRPLQLLIMATGAGGAIPVSSTTLPVKKTVGCTDGVLVVVVRRVPRPVGTPPTPGPVCCPKPGTETNAHKERIQIVCLSFPRISHPQK